MELEPFGITVKVSIMLFNGLDNVSAKALSVFLWVKKEGVPNKV